MKLFNKPKSFGTAVSMTVRSVESSIQHYLKFFEQYGLGVVLNAVPDLEVYKAKSTRWGQVIRRLQRHNENYERINAYLEKIQKEVRKQKLTKDNIITIDSAILNCIRLDELVKNDYPMLLSLIEKEINSLDRFARLEFSYLRGNRYGNDFLPSYLNMTTTMLFVSMAFYILLDLDNKHEAELSKRILESAKFLSTVAAVMLVMKACVNFYHLCQVVTDSHRLSDLKNELVISANPSVLEAIRDRDFPRFYPFDMTTLQSFVSVAQPLYLRAAPNESGSASEDSEPRFRAHSPIRPRGDLFPSFRY